MESLAHYEIVEEIGRGGMGVVYRARDTKLRRDVAIKVLPEAFVSDAERLARFEREARVLAAMSHPNVATIHELGKANGKQFLVMELVPGDDLAARLSRGPLPWKEALPLFRQLTEALSAAHEHAVVHRDLKPSNIKVTPDGRVKVLDFGLAKALEAEPAAESHSPTVTRSAGTAAGVILGTAAYMSPEQAAGRTVDKRTSGRSAACSTKRSRGGARSETNAYVYAPAATPYDVTKDGERFVLSELEDASSDELRVVVDRDGALIR